MDFDDILKSIIAGATGAVVVICFPHKKKKKKCKCEKPPKQSPFLPLVFSINNIKIGGIIMELDLKKKFTATAPIKVTDINGDEAKYQLDSAKGASSDETIATVNVVDGKLVVKPKGIGVAIGSLELDANLDDDGNPTTEDDVRTLKTEFAITVSAGEAASIGLNFEVTPDVEEGGGENGGNS